MLFVLLCTDKAFSTALRQVTRPQHLAYVAASGTAVKFAGPLLSDDGEKMEGSLIVLEAADLAAARAWAEADPYAKAGLFAETKIKPWRFLIENGQPRPA